VAPTATRPKEALVTNTVSPVEAGAPQREIVRAALRRALRAPSEYNAQPWRWNLAPGHVDLHVDHGRRLPFTDHDDHSVLLGCGAAVHHLRTALAAVGIATTVRRRPDSEDSGHLARVHLGSEALPDERVAAQAAAIEHRHTDRRRFANRPVDTDTLEDLAAAAHEQDGIVHIASGAGRRVLAEAMVDAAGSQHDAPGYAAELARWTHRLAGAEDGIPPWAVPVSQGPYRDVGMRPHPRGTLRQPRGSRDDDDASVLMVLSTAGDDPVALLRCGEAMSAVLLQATHLGLATTPLTQPLEVTEQRERVRRFVVGPRLHPHVIVRIGWPVPGAPALRATPRRALERVLDEEART